MPMINVRERGVKSTWEMGLCSGTLHMMHLEPQWSHRRLSLGVSLTVTLDSQGWWAVQVWATQAPTRGDTQQPISGSLLGVRSAIKNSSYSFCQLQSLQQSEIVSIEISYGSNSALNKSYTACELCASFKVPVSRVISTASINPVLKTQGVTNQHTLVIKVRIPSHARL